MFTLKGLAFGIFGVVVLFVALFVRQVTASMSPTKAVGRGAIPAYAILVLISPVFWVTAAALLCVSLYVFRPSVG